MTSNLPRPAGHILCGSLGGIPQPHARHFIETAAPTDFELFFVSTKGFLSELTFGSNPDADHNAEAIRFGFKATPYSKLFKRFLCEPLSCRVNSKMASFLETERARASFAETSALEPRTSKIIDPQTAFQSRQMEAIREMTFFLDGGEERTKRREAIEALVESEPRWHCSCIQQGSGDLG